MRKSIKLHKVLVLATCGTLLNSKLSREYSPMLSHAYDMHQQARASTSLDMDVHTEFHPPT